jgi:Zn-dependent peptidase ImmA (M78 family)
MRDKDILSYAQKILRLADAEASPVDVIKIARWAGVKVIKNCDIDELTGSEYGKLISDGEKWYIIFRETLPLEQKRYTVAHELGHMCLQHGAARRNLDIRHTEEIQARIRRHAEEDLKQGAKHERQADMFASSLLYGNPKIKTEDMNYVNDNTRK